MRALHLASLLALATLTAGLSACGPDEGSDWEASEIPELDSPLTALATPCAFVPTTGVASVTMATGEVAVVSRRAVDSAILVNGTACGTATSTSMKRLNVTGHATGSETVVLDFQNGTFGAGTSSSAGIVVDMAGGSGDAFKVRGASTADRFTYGDTALNFAADTIRDATVAGAESFVVSLGEGADTFTGAGGAGTGTGAFATALTLYGGAGVDALTGGDGADTVNGGDDDDVLAGGAGADTLNGGAGDDSFDEGAATNGGDTFNGGAGTDTVDYSARTAAVTVDIEATGSGTNDDGVASETDRVNDDVEGVNGGTVADTLSCASADCILDGGAGNDTLTGGAGADTILGGDGNDTITGGLGDDSLSGEAGDDTFSEGSVTSGADVFNGGAGTDAVNYGSRTAALTVTMDGAAANDGLASEGDDVNADVENITCGSGNDNVTGNNSANTIVGGDGDDTLAGGAGDDTFSEGSADNGSDSFAGGAGTDTVDYSSRTAALTVTMDGVTADDGLSGEADDVEADVENLLCGTGADTITGNALDNYLSGGAAADTLSGGNGDDLLEGGAGDDTLSGGAGDDVLDGEAGTDTLDAGAGDADICYETASNCEL